MLVTSLDSQPLPPTNAAVTHGLAAASGVFVIVPTQHAWVWDCWWKSLKAGPLSSGKAAHFSCTEWNGTDYCLLA